MHCPYASLWASLLRNLCQHCLQKFSPYSWRSLPWYEISKWSLHCSLSKRQPLKNLDYIFSKDRPSNIRGSQFIFFPLLILSFLPQTTLWRRHIFSLFHKTLPTQSCPGEWSHAASCHGKSLNDWKSDQFKIIFLQVGLCDKVLNRLNWAGWKRSSLKLNQNQYI